ncbi:MAG TPA: hypothetical protein VNJ71_12095 [Gemmatimonadales bacterium]|jgi:hypothetical protein|nr:hypothetical protein [Gemmatimonadales bacterium]
MRTPIAAAIASLAALLPSTAQAGPPWVSIEIPANPYNPATRGAYCLVRVYHHGDAAYFPLRGTAEGLVAGQRKSLPLDLEETGTPGVWAVRYQPAKDGAWVLALRVGQEEEYAGATLLVTVGNDGQIASARVPLRKQGNDLVPERVRPSDIDALLRSQAARSDRPAPDDPELGLLGVLAPLGLMGLVVRRRR